jgi:hypothetical protein
MQSSLGDFTAVPLCSLYSPVRLQNIRRLIHSAQSGKGKEEGYNETDISFARITFTATSPGNPAELPQPDGMVREVDLIIKSDYPRRSKNEKSIRS